MSSEHKPTPRINSSMLSSHAGQTVRLVGKVVKLQGNTAIVEASDQGQVEIVLNRESNFSNGTFFEIIGKVDGEGEKINEYASTNFGKDIDMSVFEALVEVTQRYTAIF